MMFLLSVLAKTYPGSVPGVSRACPGNVPGVSRDCPGSVPVVSREQSVPPDRLPVAARSIAINHSFPSQPVPEQLVPSRPLLVLLALLTAAASAAAPAAAPAAGSPCCCPCSYHPACSCYRYCRPADVTAPGLETRKSSGRCVGNKITVVWFEKEMPPGFDS